MSSFQSVPGSPQSSVRAALLLQILAFAQLRQITVVLETSFPLVTELMFLKESSMCFLMISWFLFPEPFPSWDEGRSHLQKQQDMMERNVLSDRERRGKDCSLYLGSLQVERKEGGARGRMLGVLNSPFGAEMRSYSMVGAEKNGA